MSKSFLKIRLALGVICAFGALFNGCGPKDDSVIYGLEIDGKMAGSVTGFNVATATDPATQAHPVSFVIDQQSGPAITAWVSSELSSDQIIAAGGTVARKSISVVVLDDAGEETGRVNLGKTQLDVFAVPTLTTDISTGSGVVSATLSVYPEKIETLSNEKIAATADTLAAVAVRNAPPADAKMVHKFSIELSGVTATDIISVEGLEHSHETVEYKDPEDQTTRYRPGNNTTIHASLTKAWIAGSDLETWWNDVQSGANTQRKSISVIFHNDAGEEERRYNFFECWPTSLTLPTVAERSSGHASEKLDFTSKAMNLNPGPQTLAYALLINGAYVGVGFNYTALPPVQGTTAVTDVTLEVGEGLTRAGYQWISQTLNGKATGTQNSLELIKATSDGIILDDISLTDTSGNVALDSVGLPGCDGASKDAAKMLLHLHGNQIVHRDLAARSPLITAPQIQAGYAAATGGHWLVTDFSIAIDGVASDAFSAVQTLDSITIGGGAPADKNYPKKHIGNVKYTNFKATCQPATNGTCVPGNGATMTVTYLDTKAEPILTIQLPSTILVDLVATTGDFGMLTVSLPVPATVSQSNVAPLVWTP